MVQHSADDAILDFSNTLFAFRPNPRYSDLMRIVGLAEGLGYEMPMLDRGYSLDEVKEKLRIEGPSAFLNRMWLQEDISPKAPPKSALQFVAERLNRLGPTDDLIIVDPFLFPDRIKSSDVAEYAKLLSGLIGPVVTPDATVTCVVNQKNVEVLEAMKAELALQGSGSTVSIAQTEDFHDRFWIAGRSRGVVVGTSLRGLGKRVFFIDALSDADVDSVVQELADLGV